MTRLSEPEARKAIEEWLEEEFPGHAPPFSLCPDGEENWAFWVVEEDNTSYVHLDGKIEWMGTMWEPEPDESMLDLMRHALGWPKCYRNYFVAAGEDVPSWDRLVALGSARKGKATQWSTGVVYHVTEQGIQLLKDREVRLEELANWAEETRRAYGGMERVRDRLGFDTPVYRAVRRILDEREKNGEHRELRDDD